MNGISRRLQVTIHVLPVVQLSREQLLVVVSAQAGQIEALTWR